MMVSSSICTASIEANQRLKMSAFSTVRNRFWAEDQTFSAQDCMVNGLPIRLTTAVLFTSLRHTRKQISFCHMLAESEGTRNKILEVAAENWSKLPDQEP